MASSAFRGPLPPRTPEQQQQQQQPQPPRQWSQHTSPALVPPSPHSIDLLTRQLYRTQLEATSSPGASPHGSASHTPGSPGKDKPLPALPPARTPSQMSHQRQNQYPYSPGSRIRVASSPLMSIPAGNIAGPSRLPDHGHGGACWDARTISHPHFWVPPAASPPQPRPRPRPPPSAQAPVERLPHMPTLASCPDVRAPPRRPLPAPPLVPVVASSQVPVASPGPVGEKAQLLCAQQQPSPLPQPLPPSYETLFGGPRRSSSISVTNVLGQGTAIVPPAAATSIRPLAPRSASTPAVRKTPATTTPGPPKTIPVPSIGTPRTPASLAAVKKGFTTSAEAPPARGQCWGIKRDGGRCTRAVGQSSRPVKGIGAGKTRHSSVSPTKSPAAASRQKQQRQRQKSAPPGAAVRSSPVKQDQHKAQGRKGRPIIVDDDSDPEFEISTSSDETGSISFTSSSRDEDEDEETSNEDWPLPLYCHQHAKEINKTQGFHTASSSSRYIPFSDYIPQTISDLTAARMRTAMVEPLSEADLAEEGYIYIYEILEKESSTTTPSSTASVSVYHPRATAAAHSLAQSESHSHTFLKVGRSVNPMARMAQWRSQCSSREAHLRALLPLLDPAMSQSTTTATATGVTNGIGRQGLLVGADRVLTRGIAGSHRWERLVHLELRERCASSSHSPSAAFTSTSTSGSAVAGEEVAHKCTDCGKRHREIFSVPAELGFEGVKEVVLRWERFVRQLS